MRKNLKDKKISHLNWCLEQLKYLEYKSDESIHQTLCEDIHYIIWEMKDMDDIAACEFYREEIWARKIKERLKEFNLELSV